MKPPELTAASFAGYPEPARALAVAHLGLLRAMPLPVLPGYLQQIQNYPSLFPVEASRLRLQLDALGAKPSLLVPFAAIALPPAMEQMNWVGRPGQFVAALSGALWQTGQIDAYHRAAETLFAALPVPPPRVTAPMLIAVFGRGAAPGAYPLFTRLRKEGLYARKVDGTGAPAVLTSVLTSRAGKQPGEYAHWYIDGGEPWPLPPGAGIERFTYPSLAPVTEAVLREMDRAVREGTGPELLADRLGGLSPSALGLADTDPRLARLFVGLLTENSGTQIYSTSFVQAAAVELIRRAQPDTLLLRFAPRRKAASLNDLVAERSQSAELDPQGALVDADMALYYSWLALRKGFGGERASLLAYVEGHGEAFVAGPEVVRGGEGSNAMRIRELVEMAS